MHLGGADARQLDERVRQACATLGWPHHGAARDVHHASVPRPCHTVPHITGAVS
jgi:hypothetical protein